MDVILKIQWYLPILWMYHVLLVLLQLEGYFRCLTSLACLTPLQPCKPSEVAPFPG